MRQTYYLENDEMIIDERVEKIINDFPCWIETETIEMNYVRVNVECREEDFKVIERRLKED